MSEITENGVIEWLIYVIVALVSALFALWNKHISGRLGRMEGRQDKSEVIQGKQWEAIHRVETYIEKRFTDHEKEERDRDANHAAEVAREFKELRKEMTDGHRQILELVGEVKRSVNGKS